MEKRWSDLTADQWADLTADEWAAMTAEAAEEEPDLSIGASNIDGATLNGTGARGGG